DFLPAFSIDGVAGDHDDLNVVFEIVLVQSIRFAEESPGAVAGHGIADLAAGHETGGTGNGWRLQNMEDQQTTRPAAARFIDMAKLAVALQALAFRELKRSMQPDLHRGRGELGRGQPFAAFAAAAGQDGAATTGAGAFQEATATLAAAFRWLISTFHVFF